MLKLQVIGNIGHDAQLNNANDAEFVSFRVAHTDVRYQGTERKETVVWVDVTLNGNGGELLKYLKKGTKVFVEGNAGFRIYSSKKDRTMKVGATIYARTVELCGGSSDPIPRELFSSDGNIIRVNKYFHCSEQSEWKQTLFDKDMQSYNVDENGWISIQQSDISEAD